jgi:hypothetical protein
MRLRRAIINPEKDLSVAHAFDPKRVAPRPIYDPPWGEHPDDDFFDTQEWDEERQEWVTLP